MYAFVGIGAMEIVVLGVLAVLIVVPLVFVLTRASGGSSSRVRELEEENRRLREQLGDSRDRE